MTMIFINIAIPVLDIRKTKDLLADRFAMPTPKSIVILAESTCPRSKSTFLHAANGVYMSSNSFHNERVAIFTPSLPMRPTESMSMTGFITTLYRAIMSLAHCLITIPFLDSIISRKGMSVKSDEEY